MRTSTVNPCTSSQTETWSLHQNRASTLSCTSTRWRFRSIKRARTCWSKKVLRGQARTGHLRGHLAHHETMRCELVLDTEPLCLEVAWLATTLTTCSGIAAVHRTCGTSQHVHDASKLLRRVLLPMVSA